MPLYIISIVLPELLKFILLNIPFSQYGSLVYGEYIYSFFFTYIPEGHRNAGFGWEPGIFSGVLAIAIVVNLFLNKFRLNIRFWFFTLVLITTFSTTGYILYSIILIWYLLNKSKSKKNTIIYFSLLLSIVLAIFNSPIIVDKIQFAQEESLDINSIVIGASEYADFYVHPQRIASFRIAWQDFLNNPIFGASGNSNERWYIKDYGKMENFSVISGIGNFLTIFGLTGLIIFIYYFFSSLNQLEKEYNFKYSFLIFILFLVLSFSYYIFDSPLFYTFIFYAVLKNKYNTAVLKNKLGNKIKITK